MITSSWRHPPKPYWRALKEIQTAIRKNRVRKINIDKPTPPGLHRPRP